MDFELAIPPPEGSPPSLDSVLRELTDDDETDNKSSLKAPSISSSVSALSAHKNGQENTLLHHVLLQGITAQLFSANVNKVLP